MIAYLDSSVLLRKVLRQAGSLREWREHTGGDIVMATHDVALGMAARACGLSVVGDA